MHQFYDQFM